MNIQEFQDKYYEDGEVWGEDGTIKLIEQGAEQCEHKTCWNSNVYQVADEYFEVTFSRDNSGYWSDGERYDPEFRKVVPRVKVVTVTEWVDAGPFVLEVPQ